MQLHALKAFYMLSI